ncbi:hypothetical protein FSP39_017630 [Pinctada imbricata]|uniref:Uncharacterized protein n=1 Tax=Pinctada imbricata TaxID=66713 RepID=A0AA88Y540_PINIB|nr:hypothetical protein FSP39_017630 [Pinctada imbricata]
MTDDSVCPDHHRVLRLSLTKQKQRKIFLKCKKEIEKGSTGAPSRSLLEVSTANPGNSSFKTPYKTITSSVPITNTTPLTTAVKPKIPVFGVKPGQVSTCKDQSVSVCNTKEDSYNILPVCNDMMNSNIESYAGDTAERRMIDKNTSESRNEKIHVDVQALCEARKKQSDMIETRSKVKVKPVEGILYKMKSSNGRYKLRDLFDITRIGSKKLPKPSGLESALGVTAGNAAKFTFRLADYYGVNLTHVYLGDGAFVVPDDRGNVGYTELYQGFLTVSGVDEKLISREWFINHYRWIVWKLAAYERMSNKCMDKWYLTPENVMLQMKYRYDREVDKCHRSVIKKITERDDTPSKRMVLLVSGISNHGNNKTESTGSTSNLDSKVSIELSDGWYCIPTTLDVPLSHLIQKGRIREGHKLCISGAELTGSQDACSPLEIPAGLSLSICANSTRPVTWDGRLGYHTDPRPLCVPLCSLYGEGGNVGCVDVVLLRKYPIMVGIVCTTVIVSVYHCVVYMVREETWVAWM